MENIGEMREVIWCLHERRPAVSSGAETSLLLNLFHSVFPEGSYGDLLLTSVCPGYLMSRSETDKRLQEETIDIFA